MRANRFIRLFILFVLAATLLPVTACGDAFDSMLIALGYVTVEDGSEEVVEVIEEEPEPDPSWLTLHLRELGYSENNYGFSVWGKWDGLLLPDILPEPDGDSDVIVKRVQYKDVVHAITEGDAAVGLIDFPDKYYERFTAIFVCDEDYAFEYAEEMEYRGFSFGKQPQKPGVSEQVYEWIGHNLYVCMQVKPDGEGDATCEINATYLPGNPYPQTFAGIPLPEFGIVREYVPMGGHGWSEYVGGDIIKFWDVYADEGLHTDSWDIWFAYSMVTEEDIQNYVELLKRRAFVVVDEDGVTVEAEESGSNDNEDDDETSESAEDDMELEEPDYEEVENVVITSQRDAGYGWFDKFTYDGRFDDAPLVIYLAGPGWYCSIYLGIDAEHDCTIRFGTGLKPVWPERYDGWWTSG